MVLKNSKKVRHRTKSFTSVQLLIFKFCKLIAMELTAAIKLIEKGVPNNIAKQAWADLGAGKGLFTKALATLLDKSSTVYAIDKDGASLNTIVFSIHDIVLKKIQKDFSTEEFETEQLDGILMANSLHYVNDKESFLQRLKKHLKPSGKIIVVEYDRVTANQWVPYPISYASLQKLGESIGFTSIFKIGEAPSVYHQANIYSAVLTL